MFVNELLQRFAGVRLVKSRELEALGANNYRRATLGFHKRAFDALRTIEERNGGSLTTGLKRRADEYAVSVLGHLDYAPWLYVYSIMQGTFQEGWMPDNFYHLKVVPRITKGLAELGSLKSFSNIVLRTDALPDLGYYIDGHFYDRRFNIISRAEMVELAKSFGSVFIKDDGAGNGVGIAKIAATDLNDHCFVQDCVIQKPIRQHSYFDAMVQGSVATVRITTAKGPDGAISRRGATLRLGRSSKEWVQSASQIQIAIVGDGELSPNGYMADWRACRTHPDSGFVFEGNRIPHFDKALQLCLSMHAKLPHVPVIGWDLAVNSNDEIEIIEWNGGYSGIKFDEAISGPHYRDMGWERFA